MSGNCFIRERHECFLLLAYVACGAGNRCDARTDGFCPQSTYGNGLAQPWELKCLLMQSTLRDATNLNVDDEFSAAVVISLPIQHLISGEVWSSLVQPTRIGND